MNTYTNALLEQFPEKLNFKPLKNPFLNVHNHNRVVDGLFNVIHPETKKHLKVVGTDHTPENFYTAYESCIKDLDRSGIIDMSQVKVKFRSFNGLKVMEAKIILGEENTWASTQLGEKLYDQIELRDSHDQSQRRTSIVGTVRKACENGMTSFSNRSVQRRKHTVGDDASYFGRMMAQATDNLKADIEVLKKLQDTHCGHRKSMDFIEKTFKPNKGDMARIEAIYAHYRNLNHTQYRLYNVLTHMRSHGLTTDTSVSLQEYKSVHGRSGSNSFNTSVTFEDKVTNVIQKDFMQLCGV